MFDALFLVGENMSDKENLPLAAVCVKERTTVPESPNVLMSKWLW